MINLIDFVVFTNPLYMIFIEKLWAIVVFTNPLHLIFIEKLQAIVVFTNPLHLIFIEKLQAIVVFTNSFHLIFIEKNLGCLSLIPTRQLFCCKKAVRIFPKPKSFIDHENKKLQVSRQIRLFLASYRKLLLSWSRLK